MIQKFNDFSSEKKINEEYVELPQFQDPLENLIKEFEVWFEQTEYYWDDFGEDMEEESVEEAAKNAQMEILEYLNKEMNRIIKDKKSQVKIALK